MNTPDPAGASSSEPHESRIINLEDHESQSSDSSSSTIIPGHLQEGDIIELTRHDTAAPNPGTEHSYSGASGNGETVIFTRDNQDSSGSSPQSASNQRSDDDQRAIRLFQLGLLDLLTVSRYSSTGSQLQDSSLQPAYHSANDTVSTDNLQHPAANAIIFYFFDEIKHEINSDYPNTPFGPLPAPTEEWVYLQHIIDGATDRHRFSMQIRPQHTMSDQDWRNAVALFIKKSESTVSRYEERKTAKENWWQILVDVRESKKRDKQLADGHKPQAISEDVNDFAKNTTSAATAIANVAQSKGKEKGEQGDTAKGSPSGQSLQKSTTQAQSSKKKKNKHRKKKKAKAPQGENITPAVGKDDDGGVVQSPVHDPAILESKEETSEEPTYEASQNDEPKSSTSSPGTLTSEISPRGDLEPLEQPLPRPAIPINFQFKPQRSPKSAQSDKAPKEQSSPGAKPDVSSFEGFKFDFQDDIFKEDDVNATAAANNFVKGETIVSSDQTSVEQENPSRKTQKHRKNGKARRNNSKSMTDVELNKLASPDRDQAAAVSRLKSEGTPLSIDEARGRRLSIRQGRSDSIKFIRERTVSRESSKSATLTSGRPDRLGEAEPEAAQNTLPLNPMADTFVPAASYDNDGWETVTKSQKRKGSKIQSPVPAVSEKLQSSEGPTSDKKRKEAEDSKATPGSVPISKGYNVKESEFPSLPQGKSSFNSEKTHKSHLKDPPRLGGPKKDAREAKGDPAPINPISFELCPSTAQTSRNHSLTPYESVSSKATSIGEVIDDNVKHSVRHPEDNLGPLTGPGSVLRPEFPEEAGVSAGQFDVGGLANASHEDTNAVTLKADPLATETTNNEDEQAVVDKLQDGSSQLEAADGVKQELGSEVVKNRPVSVADTEERARVVSGHAQGSVSILNRPSSGEGIEGDAATEATGSSDSFDEPRFAGSEGTPEQIPIVFNQPDFGDPRVDPAHPDHIPRDHIHFYQAFERAGYPVYRVSRLKFKCAYEACNLPIQDPVMLNTSPPKPSNKVTICNGCGPFSITRYCCREHAKAHSPTHFTACGRTSFRMVCDPRSIPSTFQVEMPQIISRVGWKNIEWSRQRAFYVYSFRQKAGLQLDYSIFDDNRESRRLGMIVRGGTKPILTICFPKSDPRKDIFNRLFNIALFDNSLSRPTEMLWRMIRENLMNAGKWTQENCDEVAIQFWYEFAVAPKETYQDFTNINFETEWEGPSGMKAICESMEAKHWILRAWRREHPERTMWRRIAGIGFPGMIPMTVHEAQQNYAPRMGWGWNGWANGKGEFFTYN
ncbi:MAG: hypothetical protein M1836_004882 [Candelina mexicana]|nr:MAG: hypothetical protein M1836_004882 [Candelina mexicana]